MDTQLRIEELELKLKELKESLLNTESGWYITTCGGSKGYICYFTNPGKNLNGEYWFTDSKDGISQGGLFDQIERKATNEEVREALNSEFTVEELFELVKNKK